MLIAVIILGVVTLAMTSIFLVTLKSNGQLRNKVSESEAKAAASQTAADNAQHLLHEEQQRLSHAQEQLLDCRATEVSLREENSRLNERIRFGEEEKQRLAEESELRFKNLANQIFMDNSRTFKEQHETRLSEILTPLKENIEQFKKTVSDSYSTEARERFSLQEKIKELMELNMSIGREAKELAVALRGNSKTQGDWGEMILENILEKSGLVRGREFTVQQTVDEEGHTLRDSEGRHLRPDVVINYPDGRCVVIDSKVSLSAYVGLVNCDDNDERTALGKQHIASVRAHIRELAQKDYQSYVGGGKTDFVMMFIPNEGAYITAMQLDDTLWQQAYEQRVLIVSPTHLISALKLVEQLWQHDRMTHNVLDIATAGGNMYDKFVGFVEDMLRIEKAITSTREAYDKALNKLTEGKGNLVSRAEKLKKMGAKVSKSLPTAMVETDNDDE